MLGSIQVYVPSLQSCVLYSLVEMSVYIFVVLLLDTLQLMCIQVHDESFFLTVWCSLAVMQES